MEGDWDDFCRGWGWRGDGAGGDAEGGLTCLNLSATLPSLDSNVTCVGFPMGGKQISVTRGVISRIDVDTLNVLRIQVRMLCRAVEIHYNQSSLFFILCLA